jgi:hypothetical protein
LVLLGFSLLLCLLFRLLVGFLLLAAAADGTRCCACGCSSSCVIGNSSDGGATGGSFGCTFNCSALLLLRPERWTDVRALGSIPSAAERMHNKHSSLACCWGFCSFCG